MNKARLLLLASVLACGSQARPSDRFSIEGRLDDGVITLQQAIRMAIDRAPELAVARARAARAGDALREARSLNLPQVVTGTGLVYNNGFPLSLEGSLPRSFRSVSLRRCLARRTRISSWRRGKTRGPAKLEQRRPVRNWRPKRRWLTRSFIRGASFWTCASRARTRPRNSCR